MDQNMRHMNFLDGVAQEDIRILKQKEQTYQGSWKRSGGVNAWHMARRKIDRLLTMLAPPTPEDVEKLKVLAEYFDSIPSNDSSRIEPGTGALMRKFVSGEDIFQAMQADVSGADGTVLAEVRDLRRYLLLFEAGLMADVGSVPAEDSNKHAERE